MSENLDAEQIAAQVHALEKRVKQRMTKEALERYGRIRMSHPQVAMEMLALLANLIKNNNTQRISEQMIRSLSLKIKG